MAGLATTGWVSGDLAPARLRLYHLIFIVFSTIAAAAIAAPSILQQRTLHRASATIAFDPAKFPGLVEAGTQSQTLLEAESQLGAVLAERYEGLGSQLRGVEYRPIPGDTAETRIEVVAFTPFVTESIVLANEAAEGLARRVYAVAGTALLRDILGRQLQASLEGHPTRSHEEVLLRRIILTGALHGGVTPVKGELSLAELSREQRNAIARALEVQYELTELDLRHAERARRAGGTEEELAQARARSKGARDSLVALQLVQQHLYDSYDTVWSNPGQVGPAFVAASATGAIAVPSYNTLKLVVAGLTGLIGGLVTVLLDRSVGIAAKLAELWAYRELIRNMIYRDLKARYKGSFLGYLWSLLNPLMTMLIFWFVFSVLLANGIPMYPVFLIVGLLPWSFAVTAVSGGMRAILDNAHLVKKVYFPREILPITVVLSNLVNYLLALPIMLVVMAGVQLSEIGHIQLSWSFAFLPVILAIQVIFLIGITLLLSTLAVFFRDTTHIVDILVQLWIFVTPVFFSLEAVTRGNALAARVVRWVNPMASLIDFYRDLLYGQATSAVPTPGFPALDGVFRTLLTALVILAIGAYVFHRHSGHLGEEL